MADHIKNLRKITVNNISLNFVIKCLNPIPRRENELGKGGKARPKTMTEQSEKDLRKKNNQEVLFFTIFSLTLQMDEVRLIGR